MIKNITYIVVFLIGTILLGLSLSETQIATSSVTIGSGSTSTITLPVQVMNADSVAFQLEVDKLNVSASITYEYITINGKTKNLPLTSLVNVLTLDSSQSAAFGSVIGTPAGVSRIRPYLYVKNMGGSSQAITYNVILVKKQR